MKKIFLVSALLLGGFGTFSVPAFAKPIPVAVADPGQCVTVGNVSASIYCRGNNYAVNLKNENKFRVSVTWSVVAKNIKTGEDETIGAGTESLNGGESRIASELYGSKNYTTYRIYIDVKKCD